MRCGVSTAYCVCGALCLPIILCLLSCSTVGEGEVEPPTSEEIIRPSPSRAASKWLAIAEDETKDIQDRIRAVYELKRLKEPATAERLIKLLPGDYGAFTHQIVGALGEIKEPRALPALWALYNEKNIVVSGKIRALLRYAIRECGGDLDDRW